MNRTTRLAVVLVGALAIAACADHPTDLESTAAPDLAAVGGASFNSAPAPELTATDRYLIQFKSQKLPGGLAAAVAGVGGSVEASYDAIGVAVVSGIGATGAAALEARSDVQFVAPDYLLSVDPGSDIHVADVGSPPEVSNDDPTTAFFYARQWNLRAIAADQAWAAGHVGSASVTAAILDTGIGYTHPDLNGLVDLDRSVSFVPSDDALVQLFFPGAHPVADLHWHGTHVAATVSSNASAAAGVTSKTTLIGVKVCNVNGQCPTSGVLAGIMYAADQGADVINISVGGLFLKSANPGFVSVINRALNYANRKRAVIVVAAGNDAVDLDHHIFFGTHFPSLYATYCDGAVTVCVSATGPATAASVDGPWTELDTHAAYSNFGRSAIDVAAPGGRGGLTGNGGVIWEACSPFSLQIPICQTGVFIIGSTGTSMASPHAAGVAALLVDRFGKNAGRVRAALHNTADGVGASGTDPLFGKGRVNAARAAGL